jgi:membrane-associated phospholipid phosphatase
MGFANLAFLASWAPLASQSTLARWFVLVYLAGLLVPWLLLRGARPLSPFGAFLHDGYPLLWTAVFWNEFGLRQAVTAISLAIPVALVGSRQPGIRRDIIVGIAATDLGCSLIYSYFPVVGPRELWPILRGTLTQGLFYQLIAGIRSTGDSLGTAFPSSHTAGAVTFAWIAWLYAPRALGWLMVSLAILIAVATVYTHNHFAIDTLAGVVVAVFMQSIVVPYLTAGRLTALDRRRAPTNDLAPERA